MAYYNYKLVRDRLPSWVTDEMGPDYEGGSSYDGDQWVAADNYIEYLELQVRKLNPEFDFSKRNAQ